MDKYELIDKAIEDYKGVFPAKYLGYTKNHFILKENDSNIIWSAAFFKDVCTSEEFNQRAKELGWVKGYKYGVEYATNSEKPNLPDDIMVCVKDLVWWLDPNKPRMVSEVCWETTCKFRITDEGYKPVSEIPESKSKTNSVNAIIESNQKSQDVSDNLLHKRGVLPPVGTVCLALYNKEYEECEILKHRINSDGMSVAAVMNVKTFHVFWSADFRPM